MRSHEWAAMKTLRPLWFLLFYAYFVQKVSFDRSALKGGNVRPSCRAERGGAGTFLESPLAPSRSTSTSQPIKERAEGIFSLRIPAQFNSFYSLSIWMRLTRAGHSEPSGGHARTHQAVGDPAQVCQREGSPACSAQERQPGPPWGRQVTSGPGAQQDRSGLITEQASCWEPVTPRGCDFSGGGHPLLLSGRGCRSADVLGRTPSTRLRVSLCVPSSIEHENEPALLGPRTGDKKTKYGAMIAG